jgi:tRNA threonylcarbamoyladenosine biosynthesis protein TsaE
MRRQNITSFAQMIEFANDISKSLKPGGVIALRGDLGSGKTFLAKHIISTLLSYDTSVTSPTFQLLQIYQASGYDIYHYDLYRLKNKNEIFELGIEDAMNGKNICIIEWPEIIFDMLPKETLVIELGFEDNIVDGRYAICYPLSKNNAG